MRIIYSFWELNGDPAIVRRYEQKIAPIWSNSKNSMNRIADKRKHVRQNKLLSLET